MCTYMYDEVTRYTAIQDRWDTADYNMVIRPDQINYLLLRFSEPKSGMTDQKQFKWSATLNYWYPCLRGQHAAALLPHVMEEFPMLIGVTNR